MQRGHFNNVRRGFFGDEKGIIVSLNISLCFSGGEWFRSKISKSVRPTTISRHSFGTKGVISAILALSVTQAVFIELVDAIS